MPKCTNSFTSEQKVTIEIIKMYQKSPYLWNSSHELFKNKELKQQAWEAMLQKWKTIDNNATHVILKKKIENLKTNFNRERRKVLNSKTSGDNNDLYVPTLWYYKYFKFLYDEPEEEEESEPTEEIQNLVIKIEPESDEEEPEKEKESSNQTMKVIHKKQAELIDSASNLLCQKDDTNYKFAVAMGLQLKEMSKLQRCIAEKIISEIMFYGKLEQLTLQSNVNLENEQSDRKNIPSQSRFT